MGKTREYLLAILMTASVNHMTYAQVIYDEDKVPKYDLTEILISGNGQKINNINEWEEIRRPEILQMFKKYMYGRVAAEVLSVQFETSQTDLQALGSKAIRKNIALSITNGKKSIQMDLLVFLPSGSNAVNPVPLFLGMNFNGNHTIHPDPGIPITKSYVRNNPDLHVVDNMATEESRGMAASRWPVERIIERGYGLATIYYGDIDPDFDDGFQNGIHSLIDYSNGNDPDERSSISGWAFGLSAAMDYFEKDDTINQDQIVVIGHSRLGKAALWAGATDQRFAIVISNDSGCGGAALSRRKFGETVKAINTQFPHWFCKNFHSYNDRENELPFDQHMLIGLIAPRPVYVASAEGGRPEGRISVSL